MPKTYLEEYKPDVIMPVYSMDETVINLTENAVNSLKGFKLIIIDNGSTVGAGLLREWADVYVRNKENLGYAKAVNQGLKLAGSIVAVANNDIRVSPNWWDVAKEALKEPFVASVHYRMIPYDQSFNPGESTWLKGKERWCTSSFFVVKNEWLYDEHFQNSCDDWDYWHRVREEGFSTAYTNKAEYQHMDSFTRFKLPETDEQDRKNRKYYVEKWGDTPEEHFERMFPGELAKQWKPLP
jgi:GT2 family glycosyltransferase